MFVNNLLKQLFSAFVVISFFASAFSPFLSVHKAASENNNNNNNKKIWAAKYLNKYWKDYCKENTRPQLACFIIGKMMSSVHYWSEGRRIPRQSLCLFLCVFGDMHGFSACCNVMAKKNPSFYSPTILYTTCWGCCRKEVIQVGTFDALLSPSLERPLSRPMLAVTVTRHGRPVELLAEANILKLCASNSQHRKSLEEGVEFSVFPKLETQEERCQIWIKRRVRPHEQMNLSSTNENTFVCSCCYSLLE